MVKRTVAASLMAASILCASSAGAQSPKPDAKPNVAMPSVAIVRIYVTDIAKAEGFYRAVFEFRGRSQMAAIHGQPERVLKFADDSKWVLVLAQAPTLPARGDMTNVAIAVSGLDALLSRVTASGGTITHPPSSPSPGHSSRLAFFKDPDGNQIEVIGTGG